MESPRHRPQQPQPQQSPHVPRRRVQPTAALPRGQQYGHPGGSQQVLETEENLSDKEVYPGGYMAIPQIGESVEQVHLPSDGSRTPVRERG